MHTKIEEEIFYPAFHDAARSPDEHIYYEAIEEHTLVDIVPPALKSTKVETKEFGARAKVLKDLIEHHAEEEETEMFPKANKAIGVARLRELGRQMQARKNGTPSILAKVAMTAGRTLGSLARRTRKAA